MSMADLRAWSRTYARTALLGGVGICVMIAVPAIVAPMAHAQSTAALRACHATQKTSSTASVPGDRQDDYFTSVAGRYTHEELLCGNGVNYGAVHIELKHKVYNWDVVDECLWNIANRYQHFEGGSKRTYVFTWRAGRSAKMVAGQNGIITAYPEWDSGSRDSWEECADQ